MDRRGILAVTGLLALIAPASASANGRFPAANQLIVSPSDPQLLVLRTTYGLLFTHDHGTSWDWVCEAAIGFVGTGDPSIGLTQKNALVLGKFDGVVVSPDTGCSWSPAAALVQKFVSDVVVRPDDPHTSLVVTSVPINTDAGTQYSSVVYRSTDDGANWAPWGNPADPAWLIETIEVAASDPHRIYLSGNQPNGSSTQTALIVSIDDGQSWATRLMPTDPVQETKAFIGAVDPQNADRVYVRTAGSPVTKPPSRLLVTDDAGKTFKPAVTLTGQMLGFALSTDGSKVFVGSVEDGLLEAKTSDFAFTQRSKIRVQCLRATATELWACSDEPSGFILGVSTDEGGSFAPKLHLNGIRGVLQCDGADSSTSICAPYLPPLCDSLGGCAQPDAGPPNPPPPPSSSSGCGCTVVPAGVGLGGAACAGIAILALVRRRRR